MKIVIAGTDYNDLSLICQSAYEWEKQIGDNQ